MLFLMNQSRGSGITALRLTQRLALVAVWFAIQLSCALVARADNEISSIEAQSIATESGDASAAIFADPELDADAPRPLAFKPVAARRLTPADLPPANPLYAVSGGAGQPRRTSVAFNRDWQAGRDEYRAIIERESAAFGLPPALLDAVMAVESGYNPAVVGLDGEIGLMQLMPATARMLGFGGTEVELATPAINIHYGAKYLAGAWRLAREDLCTATMKYRAGHGETRFSFRSVDYCVRVRGHLAARGVAVVGTVPQPSFGAATVLTGTTGTTQRTRGRRNLLGGDTVNLAALNLRLRELSEKMAIRR